MSADAGQADAELDAFVNDFFAQRCTTEVINGAERNGMPGDLWDQTQELGFTAVGVPEEAGGSGGTLGDALAVHRAVGMHAVPLPIAENYLAGWLIASAGLTIGARPATVAPSSSPPSLEVANGRATGVLEDVPWGRAASVVVVLVERQGGLDNDVVLLDPATATIRHGSDYANQPRDTFEFRQASVQVAPVPVSAVELAARAGLVRAAQMVGAMNKVSALTQRYTSERHQFGRPINSFPAVREHLVVLAQMAAMSALSVDRAADAASSADGVFECLAAKLVTSENAEEVVRAAHQAHGAIGMTKEYPLHQYTRRLHAWRSEFGTAPRLSTLIGHGAAGVESIAHLVTADRPHLSNLKGEKR